MLLQNKNAIIYGGSGAIGSAIAQAFLREGATVYLAARHLPKLEAVAAGLQAEKGRVHIAALDLTEEDAVEKHAAAVAAEAGSIDIACNATGTFHIQGKLLHELTLEEFEHPIQFGARTLFLTARATARHMKQKGRGVYLNLSTPGSRLPMEGILGFGAACALVEGFTRHLAGELGPSGIRVICLRPDAIPEALEKGSHANEVFKGAAEQAGLTPAVMLAEHAKTGPLLRRLPSLLEVGNTAAFMASDQAGAITGAIVNLTCGSLVDQA